MVKPMNILEPNLTGMIISVRSTNSPNLVQISCEMAPPHGGEIYRFVPLLPPFLFFTFFWPAHAEVAILVRIARLMAQKSCSD